MKSPPVHHISECFIKPDYLPEESKQPFYLTPWDLVMLSVHYIQKGLLYAKPSQAIMEDLLERLKNSLSKALVHFYPLAGRLKTIKGKNPHLYSVYVDCHDSPGAKFIHAALDRTVSDILNPQDDVPPVVQSFFDHHKVVNHDGHTMSLLSVQVTELVDGVFIGCSMNHCLGDGTSFWNFLNSWSEIFRAKGDDISTISISRPPSFKRWFPKGHGPIINLPYTCPNDFISSFEAPKLRERIFHFSTESMAKLKEKANAECNVNNEISSLQSLAALMWRCITRARNVPRDQTTSCKLAANNRSRLDPPLSENCFGNIIHTLRAFTTASELLEHDLGWAAWKVHQTVGDFNDKELRGWLDEWLHSPYVYQLGRFFDPYCVMMGSSPKFNMYGCEFGMGKAAALRSGYANKFDGKVSSYPGREGGASIDLEVCLMPCNMCALEYDKEFLEFICLPH